jgi:serine/threonine-protein kinase NIM1
MEHAAAGELFKRLITEGRMHESEAKNIFAQIVLAVKHLVNDLVKFIYFCFIVV